MRILQVLPRVPLPANDGGAIAMLQMAEGLQRQGHTVVWAALNTRKHYYDLAQGTLFETYTVDIDTTPTAAGAIKSLLFGRLPYTFSRFLDERFTALLQRLIREQHFDVVQLETAFMLPYTWALRAALQGAATKLVLRAHNVEHQIWARQAAASVHPLQKWYYRHASRTGLQVEKAGLQDVDGVVAISKEDEKSFRQMGYLGPAVVVPPFLKEQVGVREEAEIALACGYLGALDWAPNLAGLHWFLAEVWPKVLAALPKATFHLAGKNPPPEVSTWQVPGLVFHGALPDAGAFLDTLAVVVVPITAGGGVRLKMLEALGRAKAVLTTTYGAQGLPVADGLHLLIADTPEVMAGKLIATLADRNLRQELGAAGSELVNSHYTESAVMGTLQVFYKSLLEPEPIHVPGH